MSTVYILGAGFSMPFGYPSSRDLLGQLNKFVRTPGAFDSEWKNKWERCWKELGESKDDAVRCAFEGGNIEELLTILNFRQKLVGNRFSDSTEEFFTNSEKTGVGSIGPAFERRSHNANQLSNEYSEHSNALMEVLRRFFVYRHGYDNAHWEESTYEDMRRFAKYVQPGDTVATFNYDALAERALLHCRKWNPGNGYGFTVPLEHAKNCCVCGGESPVQVLHLHGLVGWYDGEAPLDASSLDAQFLRELGCPCRPVKNINPKYWNVIAPSYIKTYIAPYWDGTKIVELWAMAIQAIQRSSNIVVIGYSLPDADSAAMTLFSSISNKKVDIVNPSVGIRGHVSNLLNTRGNQLGDNSRGNWLDRIPDYDLSAWLNEHESRSHTSS